jgi:hypothetical protein
MMNQANLPLSVGSTVFEEAFKTATHWTGWHTHGQRSRQGCNKIYLFLWRESKVCQSFADLGRSRHGENEDQINSQDCRLWDTVYVRWLLRHRSHWGHI